MKDIPSSDGDKATGPIETLEQLFERTGTHYVRLARQWIRRYRIDENRLADEGAVHSAWIKILERSRTRPVPLILTAAEFEKEFPTVLRNVIKDARRRQQAGKRACGELLSLDAAADVPVDAHTDRPDIAEAAEEKLGLLERRNPILREIASLKMEGLSNAAIARQLKVSRSTTDRRLSEIRSILKRDPDDDN